MLADGGRRGLVQSPEAPSAAVVFHCWGEEILQISRRKGRAYAVVFLSCEYSLKATQATDSSQKKSCFERGPDVTSACRRQVPGMMPSLSGGSAKRTAFGDDHLKEIA